MLFEPNNVEHMLDQFQLILRCPIEKSGFLGLLAHCKIHACWLSVPTKDSGAERALPLENSLQSQPNLFNLLVWLLEAFHFPLSGLDLSASSLTKTVIAF